MIRRSVDLPEPDGPSSAVSEPAVDVDRDVVERLEVPNRLDTLRTSMLIRASSSLGRSSVIVTSTTTEIAASTREIPYAPDWLKFS